MKTKKKKNALISFENPGGNKSTEKLIFYQKRAHAFVFLGNNLFYTRIINVDLVSRSGLAKITC
jgi:hypothetical protein